jgi:hypothetical protein
MTTPDEFRTAVARDTTDAERRHLHGGSLLDESTLANHDRIRDEAIKCARNQAWYALDEYYNGDRVWAEQWLLRAYGANQKDEPE